MNGTSNRSLAPVEIARAALSRMAELGLPPTPENYACQYQAIVGAPPAAAPEARNAGSSPDPVQMVQGILDLVSHSAAELATGIGQFQSDTGAMLAGIDSMRDEKASAGLLRAFMAATLSLRQTVAASRRELDETRHRLEEVTGELNRTSELARTDPLTGFGNRRAMGEIIARDIARARRTKDPFCSAILDVDHFKKVNDEYGHAVGDKALVHLGFVVKSAIRETDVICRYGGEEFVVVLPGAAAQGARFVIDRLRVMVENSPLVHGKDRLTIRFSAGVAELQPGETVDGLLERADQALYEAKRAGRNRVVVASSEADARTTEKRVA